MDSYLPQQISQPDCEISSICGKITCGRRFMCSSSTYFYFRREEAVSSKSRICYDDGSECSFTTIITRKKVKLTKEKNKYTNRKIETTKTKVTTKEMAVPKTRSAECGV